MGGVHELMHELYSAEICRHGTITKFFMAHNVAYGR